MTNRIFRILYGLIILALASLAVAFQDGERSIKSEEYLEKRPAPASETTLRSATPLGGLKSQGRSGGTRPKNDSAANSLVYVVDKNFPVGPAPAGREYVRLGMTIWRFTPNQCAIPNCPLPTGGTKGLFDTAAGTRVDDNAAFSTGERVRLGLELLARDGFVYIIDREQFADNSYGEPYLIFPTRSINGGKHLARPGQQIQLPRAGGCFCVKSRQPAKPLVADNLIVVVSPAPLLDANEIGEKEIAMPARLASYVQRADKERAFRATLKGGAGLAQTAQEQSAGTKGLFDTEPVLTQTDLPPQNFYQVLVPAKSPAVFSLYLRYDAKPVN